MDFQLGADARWPLCNSKGWRFCTMSSGPLVPWQFLRQWIFHWHRPESLVARNPEPKERQYGSIRWWSTKGHSHTIEMSAAPKSEAQIMSGINFNSMLNNVEHLTLLQINENLSATAVSIYNLFVSIFCVILSRIGRCAIIGHQMTR